MPDALLAADDGGAGAEYVSCALGTDCSDCGHRSTLSPSPPQSPQPPSLRGCTESCNYASDGTPIPNPMTVSFHAKSPPCVFVALGACDDGGADSQYSFCDLGTDCSDCGPNMIVATLVLPPSPAQACRDTCTYAFDGACDDGGPDAQYTACSLGSDCSDCNTTVSVCHDSCSYAADDECDDGGLGADYAFCQFATDCADCGSRSLAAVHAAQLQPLLAIKKETPATWRALPPPGMPLVGTMVIVGAVAALLAYRMRIVRSASHGVNSELI